MRYRKYIRNFCAFVLIVIPFSSSAGIIGTSSNIIQSTLGSSLLVNEVVDVNNAFLFTENLDLNLGYDVFVNFSGPGDYDNFLRNEPATIQINAGTRVSSYVLHFDTPDSTASSVSVSITFGDPILGIISSTPDLLATDNTLGLAAVQYETIRYGRGLEGIDVIDPFIIDTVNISANRKTITANLGVTDGLDNIRIVTASVRAVPEPPVLLLMVIPTLLALRRPNKAG